MDNPGDAKYGMTTEQIYEAFRTLRKKGVEEFGIHSFLCSNTVTNEYYPCLQALLNLLRSLKAKLEWRITFINLSGGIGNSCNPIKNLMIFSLEARKAYEEVLVPAGMDDVSIYTEQRYMLGPYGGLITKSY